MSTKTGQLQSSAGLRTCAAAEAARAEDAIHRRLFEALEPVRQGVRRHFGGPAPDAARGLSLRHDHGSRYMSRHFQQESPFLGIRASPSFVREPQGNGVAERFIRTLKDRLLRTRDLDTVEELNQALREWRILYNEHRRLAQRHRHRSPAQVRRELMPRPAQRDCHQTMILARYDQEQTSQERCSGVSSAPFGPSKNEGILEV